MAICCIFGGQLDLTSEKLLCSVPMLSGHFGHTIKGMRINISAITEVLDLKSIHLFKFQAIHKNGEENHIVQSLFL